MSTAILPVPKDQAMSAIRDALNDFFDYPAASYDLAKIFAGSYVEVEGEGYYPHDRAGGPARFFCQMDDSAFYRAADTALLQEYAGFVSETATGVIVDVSGFDGMPVDSFHIEIPEGSVSPTSLYGVMGRHGWLVGSLEGRRCSLTRA